MASELGRFELNFAMELRGRERWTEAVTELPQAIDTWERLASMEPTIVRRSCKLSATTQRSETYEIMPSSKNC